MSKSVGFGFFSLAFIEAFQEFIVGIEFEEALYKS